jgi:hypothetical protein
MNIDFLPVPGGGCGHRCTGSEHKGRNVNDEETESSHENSNLLESWMELLSGNCSQSGIKAN